MNAAQQVVGGDNTRASFSLAACNRVNIQLFTARPFELKWSCGGAIVASSKPSFGSAIAPQLHRSAARGRALIRKIVVILCMVCIATVSLAENEKESRNVYTIKTGLPQLVDEIGLKSPVQLAERSPATASERPFHSSKSQSQFAPWPQQNTWVVIGVVAAFLVAIILFNTVLGGT